MSRSCYYRLNNGVWIIEHRGRGDMKVKGGSGERGNMAKLWDTLSIIPHQADFKTSHHIRVRILSG